MGAVKLLAEARALGLEVAEEGGRLKIRGAPEHEEMVQRLLAARTDVMTALRAETDRTMFPVPTTCCRNCGGRVFWRRQHGNWLCMTCHPAPCQDVVESHKTVIVPRDAWALEPPVMKMLERHGWEGPVEFAPAPEFDTDEARDGKEGDGDDA